MFRYVGWLGAWCYISIVRVAGYYSSAQLAGESRNTRRMLYPGSVKALLHSTTYAVCSPVLLIFGIIYVSSRDEQCLATLAGLAHGEL